MPVKHVPSPLALYATSIVRGLIDNEASLELYERRGMASNGWGGEVEALILEVRMARDDVGKVLGRGGENITAIRRLLYAFGKKHRLGHIVFQASESQRL